MTILISSKKDGFRRCNMAHPKGPTPYADDHFTDKELDVLGADPMLKVEYLADDSVAETPAPEEMTVAELKALLDTLDVDYTAGAKKAGLVDLVKQHTAEPPAEE